MLLRKENRIEMTEICFHKEIETLIWPPEDDRDQQKAGEGVNSRRSVGYQLSVNERRANWTQKMNLLQFGTPNHAENTTYRPVPFNLKQLSRLHDKRAFQPPWPRRAPVMYTAPVAQPPQHGSCKDMKNKNNRKTTSRGTRRSLISATGVVGGLVRGNNNKRHHRHEKLTAS